MPDRHLVHRRTAVLGVAATFLVAGCDHGDDIGQPTPSGSPSATTASASPAAPTPDQALVDATLEQLNAAFGVLVTARKFPALRQALAPLVRAHRRHVEVLEGDVAGTASPGLADASAALHAVRRSEARLQSALVDTAGKAESGALAKLLASMSASTAQQLATLPKEA